MTKPPSPRYSDPLQLVVLLLLSLAWGCGQGPQWVKNQYLGNALGTTYAITYITPEKTDFQPAIDSIFGAINASMSTYMPGSDISKINNGDSTVVTDRMFREVYDISNKVYLASKGYFDPTVGVLADAWGFGPGRQLDLDSAKVDSLLQFVGFDKVRLTERGTVQKRHPAIRFDFNAVAKGYAIDRLATMLDAKGIADYLVEVGGEIYASGTNKLAGKAWTIGIDNPNDLLRRGSAATIALQNRALASSGNYRKFRIDPVTGEKYVHTIDPKTGYPKNSKVLAATVVADDCATADAFATAFMAMALEDSKHYLEQRDDIEAFIIHTNKNGESDAFATEGFKAMLLTTAF